MTATFGIAPSALARPISSVKMQPNQELGVWLLALDSFFRPQNHPLSDAERQALDTRDFSREIRIARNALLDTLRLTLSLSVEENDFFDAGEHGALGAISLTGFALGDDASSHKQDDWLTLAENLQAACDVCDALAENPRLNGAAWDGIGRLVAQKLTDAPAARRAMQEACAFTCENLPPLLQPLLRQPLVSPWFDAALRRVFLWFERLHSRLRLIEQLLVRDQPLKQALPLFTLVYEETRELLEYLQNQVLTLEGVPEEIFDTLDGTAYAIQMETRKVFAHEMVGFSALRPAPLAYAKTETAHGLLANSFQESTVILARLFAPDLEGVALFPSFQTRLQHSLTLRGDLWRLLQMTQCVERERAAFPVERLLGQLELFRNGSLKFLMYKDLEACERFIEEVAMARGTTESASVLHRFAAYLETLHGQVNMRTVLANYPFDYPELEA